ncbi:MAG TPA: class I SAM-dependent methyltransferase [Bacteroidia bacterium]|nr:class I SAM-dependent methyltransferase [Bacteroidia bacterium]
MEKSYYEEYYRYERSHWWFTVRSRILENTLRRHLPKGKKPRILNIGVATGASTEMLMKLGEVTSVEYDKDCCEFVSGILGTKVYNESITALPFGDSSFDIVCAFDVIEHVADHVTAVAEMERVCSPGGLVFVTVPAFMSLWSKHDVINHHERRYRLKGLRELFRPRKGHEVRSSYFNTILFPPIFIFRQAGRLLFRRRSTEEATSDFETVSTTSFTGKIINRMLGALFSMEIFLLRFMRFPAGVSILFLWQKD